MAAHKKGLRSEAVDPKKYFFIVFYSVIIGNSSFQRAMFLYFMKVVGNVHSLMDTVFILEDQLQP